MTRLQGGVDTDGDGVAEPYVDWSPAPIYPEVFTDSNSDGRWQRQEVFFDINGDGVWQVGEPHEEIDGDGVYTPSTETLADSNANARFDASTPEEVFTDTNGNGRWDNAEPFWDRNANGVQDPPANISPPPWRAWNPATDAISSLTMDAYIYDYGEPFGDFNGNGVRDPAEPLTDRNGNGCARWRDPARRDVV